MRLDFRSSCVLSAICLLMTTSACVSPSVRRSAIRWNLRSQQNTETTCHSSALSLASRSQEELGRLMESQPAPEPLELVGTWYGVNKGFCAAMAGLHQDVKVFYACGTGVSGHNILVEQVAVEELACKGWRPKRDRATGLPKQMGNFVVETCNNRCGKGKLQLNYSKAENPTLDPSRFLVDELVVIEPGLLLGRARVQIGAMDLPVAYFVLTRDASQDLECDSYRD